MTKRFLALGIAALFTSPLMAQVTTPGSVTGDATNAVQSAIAGPQGDNQIRTSGTQSAGVTTAGQPQGDINAQNNARAQGNFNDPVPPVTGNVQGNTNLQGSSNGALPPVTGSVQANSNFGAQGNNAGVNAQGNLNAGGNAAIVGGNTSAGVNANQGVNANIGANGQYRNGTVQGSAGVGGAVYPQNMQSYRPPMGYYQGESGVYATPQANGGVQYGYGQAGDTYGNGYSGTSSGYYHDGQAYYDSYGNGSGYAAASYDPCYCQNNAGYTTRTSGRRGLFGWRR